MTCPSHDRNGVYRRSTAKAPLLPLCLAALMLAMPAAHAADWPSEAPLRGSFQPPAPAGSSGVRWDGIVFGAHFGVSNMNTDYSHATQPLIGSLITNSTVGAEVRPQDWILMPNATSSGRQYGGFVGYNMQWDDVVVGFDVAYNRGVNLGTSSNGSIRRVVATSDGVVHDIGALSTGSITLLDYAALRFRAGYTFGQFMPFAVLGAAVGRFDQSTSVEFRDVQSSGGNTSTFAPPVATSSKQNSYVGGFVGGLGVDVALLPNVFLRAEWEYAGFAKVNGISTSMNTGRVGVGVRF